MTTDWAVVAATFLGPVFAVQAQRYVDGLREIRQMQEATYLALFATRATPVHEKHVEALNAIPVAFHRQNVALVWLRPGRGKQLDAILVTWRELLACFNENMDGATQSAWDDWDRRRMNLDFALITKIGDFLGWTMATVDLRTQTYFPVGHGKRINDQDAVLQGFAKVFRGESKLPIEVSVAAAQGGASANDQQTPQRPAADTSGSH